MSGWFLNLITFIGFDSEITPLVKHYGQSPDEQTIIREKYSFFNQLFYKPSSLFCHPEARQDFTLSEKLNDDLIQYNLKNLGCTFVGMGYLKERKITKATVGLFTRFDTPLIGLARIANMTEYSNIIIDVHYYRVPESSQSSTSDDLCGHFALMKGKLFSVSVDSSKTASETKSPIKIADLLADHEKSFYEKAYLFLKDSKYAKGAPVWRKDLYFEGTIFEKTQEQIQNLPTYLKMNYRDKWMFVIRHFIFTKAEDQISNYYHGEIIYKNIDGDDNYHLFLNKQFSQEYIFKSRDIDLDYYESDLSKLIIYMKTVVDKINPLIDLIVCKAKLLIKVKENKAK